MLTVIGGTVLAQTWVEPTCVPPTFKACSNDANRSCRLDSDCAAPGTCSACSASAKSFAPLLGINLAQSRGGPLKIGTADATNPAYILDITGTADVSARLRLSGAANIQNALVVDTDTVAVDTQNNWVVIGPSAGPQAVLRIEGGSDPAFRIIADGINAFSVSNVGHSVVGKTSATSFAGLSAITASYANAVALIGDGRSGYGVEGTVQGTDPGVDVGVVGETTDPSAGIGVEGITASQAALGAGGEAGVTGVGTGVGVRGQALSATGTSYSMYAFQPTAGNNRYSVYAGAPVAYQANPAYTAYFTGTVRVAKEITGHRFVPTTPVQSAIPFTIGQKASLSAAITYDYLPEGGLFDGTYLWTYRWGWGSALSKTRASDGVTVATYFPDDQYGLSWSDSDDMTLDTVTAGGPYLWTANNGTHNVSRFKISDATWTAFPVNTSVNPPNSGTEGANRAILFDTVTPGGPYIWTANRWDNNLSKLNATTGAFIAQYGFDASSQPNSITVAVDPAADPNAAPSCAPNCNVFLYVALWGQGYREDYWDPPDPDPPPPDTDPNPDDDAWIWIKEPRIAKVRSVDGVKVAEFPITASPITPHPRQIIFDGTNLWVANWPSGDFITPYSSGQRDFDITISKLSQSGTLLVDKTRFPSVGLDNVKVTIAWDGTYLWAGGGRELGKFNVNGVRQTCTGFVYCTLGNNFHVGGGTVQVVLDSATPGGPYVWTADPRSQQWSKVLASTGERLSTHIIQGSARDGNIEADILFDGTSIWLTNNRSDSVRRIRASDGTLVEDIQTMYDPTGLAFDGQYLFISGATSYYTQTAYQNGLTRIPVTGDPTADTFCPAAPSNPRNTCYYALPNGYYLIDIALGAEYLNAASGFKGRYVWMLGKRGGFPEKLFRVNPETGALDQTVDITVVNSSSNFGALAYDGTYLWVANQDEYSAGDNDQIVRVLEQSPYTQTAVSVGDGPNNLIFDGAYVWVTNFHSGTLSKIQADNATVVGTYPAGAQGAIIQPRGLAFDGAHIWVGNNYNVGPTGGPPRIARIRAADGAVLEEFSLGSWTGTTDLAFDGTSVWSFDPLFQLFASAGLGTSIVSSTNVPLRMYLPSVADTGNVNISGSALFGGSLSTTGDVAAAGNVWGGSDDTLAAPVGGTAACANGQFLKGVVTQDGRLTNIVCQKL